MFSKDTLYNGAGVGQVPAVPAVLAWEIIGCESMPELSKVLRVPWDLEILKTYSSVVESCIRFELRMRIKYWTVETILKHDNLQHTNYI